MRFGIPLVPNLTHESLEVDTQERSSYPLSPSFVRDPGLSRDAGHSVIHFSRISEPGSVTTTHLPGVLLSGTGRFPSSPSKHQGLTIWPSFPRPWATTLPSKWGSRLNLSYISLKDGGEDLEQLQGDFWIWKKERKSHKFNLFQVIPLVITCYYVKNQIAK